MAAHALLISADANTVSVLGQVLADMDIVVEECSDFLAAGEKLTRQKYDVILVDSLEEETADRLLRQVRLSRENRSPLTISVVSAQASVRKAFAMGANFVLYRPVSADRAKASLHAASHLMRQEKRRHPRVAVHSPATVSYPAVESAPVTLLDLSEAGLAIQGERRLPAKSKLYFRFMLPSQMKWIQLSGDTIWQDSTGRAGIRFVHVPQSARHLLKEWLNSRVLVQESQATRELSVGQPGRLPSSPADRRIQARHACHLGSDIYRAGSDVPHRCSLSDISVGGCYVELPSPFATETSVEIVVRTQTFKFRSRGLVQVVHPGFGMGVVFASQTDEQRDQVQQLIKLVYQDRAADSDPVLRF